jgi:SAM-dependent methyltransferase
MLLAAPALWPVWPPRKWAGHVTGLDLNAGMLAVARGVSGEGPPVNGMESSALDLPFPSNRFDAVLCPRPPAHVWPYSLCAKQKRGALSDRKIVWECFAPPAMESAELLFKKREDGTP